MNFFSKRYVYLETVHVLLHGRKSFRHAIPLGNLLLKNSALAGIGERSGHYNITDIGAAWNDVQSQQSVRLEHGSKEVTAQGTRALATCVSQ